MCSGFVVHHLSANPLPAASMISPGYVPRYSRAAGKQSFDPYKISLYRILAACLQGDAIRGALRG